MESTVLWWRLVCAALIAFLCLGKVSEGETVAVAGVFVDSAEGINSTDAAVYGADECSSQISVTEWEKKGASCPNAAQNTSFTVPQSCPTPGRPLDLKIIPDYAKGAYTALFWIITPPKVNYDILTGYLVQISKPRSNYRCECHLFSPMAKGKGRASMYANKDCFRYSVFRNRSIMINITSLPTHSDDWSQQTLTMRIQLNSCSDIGCKARGCPVESCFKRTLAVRRPFVTETSHPTAVNITWSLALQHDKLDALILQVSQKNVSVGKHSVIMTRVVPLNDTFWILDGLPRHVELVFQMWGRACVPPSSCSKCDCHYVYTRKSLEQSYTIQPEVHGSWNPWSLWGDCNCTLAEQSFQRQSRRRNCSQPEHGGRNCSGKADDVRDCVCPSVWSRWSTLHLCTINCGPKEARRRTCWKGFDKSECIGQAEEHCHSSCSDDFDLQSILIGIFVGLGVLFLASLVFWHCKRAKANLHTGSPPDSSSKTQPTQGRGPFLPRTVNLEQQRFPFNGESLTSDVPDLSQQYGPSGKVGPLVYLCRARFYNLTTTERDNFISFCRMLKRSSCRVITDLFTEKLNDSDGVLIDWFVETFGEDGMSALDDKVNDLTGCPRAWGEKHMNEADFIFVPCSEGLLLEWQIVENDNCDNFDWRPKLTQQEKHYVRDIPSVREQKVVCVQLSPTELDLSEQLPPSLAGDKMYFQLYLPQHRELLARTLAEWKPHSTRRLEYLQTDL